MPTILVVEDDEMLLALERLLLERAAWKVLAATSVEAALALGAAAEEVDVLLTDLVLLGGSGWSLAADLLRLHPRLSPVFASGYGDERAGVGHLRVDEQWRLVRKPFLAGALLDVLSRAYMTPFESGEALLRGDG